MGRVIAKGRPVRGHSASCLRDVVLVSGGWHDHRRVVAGAVIGKVVPGCLAMFMIFLASDLALLIWSALAPDTRLAAAEWLLGAGVTLSEFHVRFLRAGLATIYVE